MSSVQTDLYAGDIMLRASSIPMGMISKELAGIYGENLLKEINEIIKLYIIYEKGSVFIPEGTRGDYVPSSLRYRKARALIDKEARFLFSKQPDITVMVDDIGKKENRDKQSVLQSFINKVLQKNNFRKKLLQAAKDCFIGKRVACVLNFNEAGIQLHFIPSLEFVYDTDPNDISIITKLVTFYTMTDAESKGLKRIYKKKYVMENGFCYVSEEIYDGSGNIVETIIPLSKTEFTYIPAVVICNDGLTGDLNGESEIGLLEGYESYYSKIANADIDAERKSMNPIRYTIDMSPESTKDLSGAPGSFWDLSTEAGLADSIQGQVGLSEPNMNYAAPLSVTLERLSATMFETLDIPDVSTKALQGIVSSGKTLKAIYWSLIVRCEEKMLTWGPALEFITRAIIDGAKLYPESAKPYTTEELPEVEYMIEVVNQYPLPEDETEEKETDIAEVNAQVMSKKAYMKKWRNLTDDEADAELVQLVKEKELFAESYVAFPTPDDGKGGQPNDDDNDEIINDEDE